MRADEAVWRRRDAQRYKSGLFGVIVGVNMFFGLMYAVGPMFVISGAWDFIKFLAKDWQVSLLILAAAACFGLLPFQALSNSSMNSRRWAEHYVEQLAQILRAGRGVTIAPDWQYHQPLVAGSAREVLGLGPFFTPQELRCAWLGLVRELHPDRWATASPSVRHAKEEAMKRVNAAKDELEKGGGKASAPAKGAAPKRKRKSK